MFTQYIDELIAKRMQRGKNVQAQAHLTRYWLIGLFTSARKELLVLASEKRKELMLKMTKR